MALLPVIELASVELGGHSVVVACRAVSDFGGGGVGDVVAGMGLNVVGGGGGPMACIRVGFCIDWGRTIPARNQ